MATLDKRIDKCASCCDCFTRVPASSHFLTSLLLLLPLCLSLGTLAYSESSVPKAAFPPTFTSWRVGLSSVSLILCIFSWAALHKLAPGFLRLFGYLFTVLGHWAFVLATVDAQFARDACHAQGWSAPFCTAPSSDYQGAAQSLATAAPLDGACLVLWLLQGAVLQQRARLLQAQAEQAAAAAAMAEGATITGTKKITISVSG